MPEPFVRLKKFNFCWQIICSFPTTYSKSVLGDRRYLPILVYGKGKKPKVRRRASDFVYATELPVVVGKIGNTLFKPTVATSQLLQMFSNEGDTVLDPFAGFGSIPLVCKLWKRNFIAFEISEKICQIAKKIMEEGRVGFIGQIEEEETDNRQQILFEVN